MENKFKRLYSARLAEFSGRLARLCAESEHNESILVENKAEMDSLVESIAMHAEHLEWAWNGSKQ